MRQIMPKSGPKFDRRWKASDDEPVQKKDKKGVPLNPVQPDDSADQVDSDAIQAKNN